MIASRGLNVLQGAFEALEDDRFFYVFCAAFILILGNACGQFVTFLSTPVPTLAIGVIVTVVVFLRPEIGLSLFIASVFLEECWLVGGVTIAKAIGLLTLVAWLVRLLFSGDRRVILPPQAWLTALLLAFGLLSIFWAPNDHEVVRRVIMGGGVLGAFVVIVNVVDSPASLRRVSNVIALAGFVAAVVALDVYFFGKLFEPGFQRARVVPQQEPNTFGASLIPAFALFSVMLMRRQEPLQRAVWGLGHVVVVVSILLSMSRALMIILPGVVVLALALIPSHRQRIILLLLALVEVVIAFYLSPMMPDGGSGPGYLPRPYPTTLPERAASIVTLETRGQGRVDIWLAALTMVSTHPIRGIGLSNFPVVFFDFYNQTPGVQEVFVRGMPPHNIYLGMLAELGVIGFVLLAGILGISVISAVRARRDSHHQTKDSYLRLASDIWLLSLAGLLMQGLFLDILYRKFFWLGLALVEVVRRLLSQQEEFGGIESRDD